MLTRSRIVGLMVLCLCAAAHAEDAPATQPSTQPAVISAGDAATLAAKKGETVTVEGVIAKAEWSKSGKVFNVEFKDIEADKGLMVSAFQKNKEKLDAAFDGDAAAKLTGAKIQITGKLEVYGGKIEKFKDRLQIVIQNPQQITIVEPAPKP